jgi:four helix bundle protein
VPKDDDPIWFPHYSLDAYRVAMKLAVAAKRLTSKIPRGHRTLADQWLRAAGGTVLLVAEGASRFNPGEKRQRYGEARGECGEAAAACEVAMVFDFVPPDEGRAYLADAARLGSVLTGLYRRFGGIPAAGDGVAEASDPPPDPESPSPCPSPSPRPVSSSDSDSDSESESASASGRQGVT